MIRAISAGITASSTSRARLIQSTGAKLTEPSRNRSNSFCCGAGGGQFWKEEEKGTERVSTNRYRELKANGRQNGRHGLSVLHAHDH